MKLLLVLFVFVCSQTCSAQKGLTDTLSLDPLIVVHNWVDEKAAPGYDLVSYLGHNFRYPDSAISAGVEGKVIVKFIVNEDGSISNAKTIGKPIGYGFEKEALRLINGLPKWKPAMLKGVPVKSYYTQPITFSLH